MWGEHWIVVLSLFVWDEDAEVLAWRSVRSCKLAESLQFIPLYMPSPSSHQHTRGRLLFATAVSRFLEPEALEETMKHDKRDNAKRVADWCNKKECFCVRCSLPFPSSLLCYTSFDMYKFMHTEICVSLASQMGSKKGCNFSDVVNRPTESPKDTNAKNQKFKLKILLRLSYLGTAPWNAFPRWNRWYLECSQRTNSEHSTMYACKVFAPPQHSWHLYPRPHGLNSLGKRGHRCLAPRYHLKNKIKIVDLVALYLSYKGTYTGRANANVAAIANVMKQADSFIFARSG